MISFWRIFSLELKSLFASRTVHILLAVSIAIMLFAPWKIFFGGLGAVFALLLVSLMIVGAGSMAKEKAAHRLQLTQVRPVRLWVIPLAKSLSISLVGSAILLVATGTRTLLSAGRGRSPSAPPQCYHVILPILPSVSEVANAMYDSFMADPNTPTAAKRAKKEVVIRLLKNKESDRYETIRPGETVTFTFPTTKFANCESGIGNSTLRLRINKNNKVEEILQPVTPPQGSGHSCPRVSEAQYTNSAKIPVLYRPRQDVALLIPADSYYWNLFRAYLELASLLTALIAFSVFLSAFLSRPVAVFVAVVVLMLGEMSPAVIDNYPDELEENKLDSIALVFTRVAAECTHPISALNPLERLNENECIEWNEVLKALALNVVLLPLLFALLGGKAPK